MEDLNIYNPPGSELRKLQLKMVEMLDVVDAICKKHHITYWIGAGTLLGAVRHKGFIPWDDDLDIELLRKDYKRLLKVLPEELPESLSLQIPCEKYYNLLFAKVRYKYSEVEEDDECSTRYKQKGIFIDIFPVERSYKPLKDFVDFFYGRAFRRLKRGKPFHSFRYFFEYVVSLLMWPFAKVLVFFARMISGILKPTTIVYGYGINIKATRNIDSILPVSKAEFEGREYSAPADQDAYLKIHYGDYMKIPPAESRKTHYLSVKFLNEK